MPENTPKPENKQEPAVLLQPQPTLWNRFFSLGQWANGAQWISAACSVLTAIAAIVAVIAFMHSLKVERIKAAEESIARLYPMENEIERLLITSDFNSRVFFRNDKEGKHFFDLLEKDDAKSIQKFKAACALNGNMFEYYLLIRENIKGHPQGDEIIEAWNGYLRTMCEDSYGFRAYFYHAPHVWTKSLQKEVGDYAKGLPKDLPKDKKITR